MKVLALILAGEPGRAAYAVGLAADMVRTAMAEEVRIALAHRAVRTLDDPNVETAVRAAVADEVPVAVCSRDAAAEGMLDRAHALGVVAVGIPVYVPRLLGSGYQVIVF